MEKGAKGNENCFDLAGVSSYRGFELLGVDCNVTGEKETNQVKCYNANNIFLCRSGCNWKFVTIGGDDYFLHK